MGEYNKRSSQGLRAAFARGGVTGAFTALFHDEAMESVARYGRGPANAPDLSEYARLDEDPLERYLPHGELLDIRASLLQMIKGTDAGETSRDFARTLLAMAEQLPHPGRYEMGFLGMMQCQIDGLVPGIPAAPSPAPKASNIAAPDGPTHFAVGPVSMRGSAAPVGAGVRH